MSPCQFLGVDIAQSSNLGSAGKYWLRLGCRLKWLELLGAAPVDVAVLLASWEVCSWSRSGLFAAFIDDGFFAVSWKEVLLLHGAK
ncbi:hypothetical protein V6N13_050567 [Hibiscus sabdariffa]